MKAIAIMMRLITNKIGGSRITPETSPANNKYAWVREGTQNTSGSTGC